MKLSIQSGEVLLPEDNEFEIESSHPFFSDEGTASVPITIPASNENLALFGQPAGMRNAHRMVRKFPAMLYSGLFQKQCRIIMESAGDKNGIAASLLFEESEMYSSLRDRKIRDILAGKWYVATKSTMRTPTELYQNTRFPGVPEDLLSDVVCFPVAVKGDGGNVFIVNEADSTGNIKGEQARVLQIDGKSVNVPAYYGVAFFLYLWALVEYTFTLSGYTVSGNIFKTDPELRKIVVVHNVCDAMTDPDGYGFSYASLAPSMTAGELITTLRDVFGAVVSVRNNDVSISLMRDILDAQPDFDLTPYESEGRILNYPEQSRLERSFDTSIESAEPAAETVNDFAAAYENVPRVTDAGLITEPGVYYVPVLNKYYIKDTRTSDVRLLGSDCFKYSRPLDIDEVEDLSPELRFLPMIKVDSLYMPFIGDRVHAMLDIDKDPDAEQALQLCYVHWQTGTPAHYCGSSYSYNEKGGSVLYMVVGPGGKPLRRPYSPLTPEGLGKYWSSYERLLVNGAPTIETAFSIPLPQLLSLDRNTVKFLDGSRVIFRSMSYVIADSLDRISVKASLQLLPDYVDEVPIPALSVKVINSYRWKLVSTRTVYNSENITITETDGKTDYTVDDAPDIQPNGVSIITMRRSRWLVYHQKYWISSFDWGYRKYTHKWEEYFISEQATGTTE